MLSAANVVRREVENRAFPSNVPRCFSSDAKQKVPGPVSLRNDVDVLSSGFAATYLPVDCGTVFAFRRSKSWRTLPWSSLSPTPLPAY